MGRAGRFAMRCAWALLAMLQFTAISARAQSGEAASAAPRSNLTPDDVVRMTTDAHKRGNELTALDLLRDLQRKLETEQPQTYRVAAQITPHFEAAVGNYREALRHFGLVFRGTQPALQSADEYPLKDLRPERALTVLDSMTDQVRIVMINEAHHVPQHRAFTIELLPLLWRKGFRYLAAETLLPADARLQERGYPTLDSGYYTAEPVYGDLIRTALRLGYQVVAYEASPGTKDREQAQAQNLVDRILKDDPQARVLIHAGFDHINESGELAGVPTMARRLKEMTGLDPLTIDQTVMSERVPEEQEQPVYRYLMAHAPITAPTIFTNAEGWAWAWQPGTRDITLFHPRSKYVDGRPTWLTLGGARGPYKVPRKICANEKRCLVKARLSHESSDAIPIDQLEVLADQPAPTLMLPAGTFTLEVEDATGRTLKTQRIVRNPR